MAAGILAGTGYVRIRPDLSGFGAALTAGVNRNLSGLQKSAQVAKNVGSTLTKFVSLPLAAAGVASVKMALDFDQSFARISALAGKLGVSMEDAKKHVLALAGETAQSPQQLADALYFVASAGLDANKVMSVLDFSARGAAAGFGDAETIAKSLTTTLNAYKGTNLTAATSMNVLTAAVKEGKAEASDFAEGMGQVAGVAATAGISFQDLAAAIAQSSKTLPVERAITGFRFLIQSLVSPTEKAKNALKDYGVSVQSVFDALAKPGGLQHELQFLSDTFDLTTVKGRAAWAAVVGGARGAVVATTLVGDQAKATNKVLEATNAAGLKTAHTFQTAFGKATNTDLFRARAAMEKLRASAIQLGEKLIPVATKLITFFGDLADKFSNLSPAAQENIIKFGALAIAAGPVLRIFGGLIGPVAKLVGALTGLGGAAGGAAGGLSRAGGAAGLLLTPVGAAVGILGLLALKFKLASDEAKQNAEAVQALAGRMITGKTSAAALAIQLKNENIPEWAKAALIQNVLSKSTAEAERRVRAFKQQAIEVIGPLSANTQQMVEAALKAGDYKRAMGLLQAAMNGYFASLPGATGRTGKMASAHQQAADAALDQTVRTDGLRGAINRLHDKHITVTANTSQAISAIYSFQNALNNLQNKTVYVYSIARNISDPSHAEGAVFPKFAGGAQFYSPMTGPFIAGEGSSPTFAGRGAEVVSNAGVMPLPDRIIDRLGDRIAARASRGGSGRPIVVKVMVDRREIARAVTNSAVWDG